LVELVDAGEMKVEVVNSGLWVCPSVDSEKMSGGNGLDLLRSRLKLIYGDNVRMEFPAAVERAEVVMRIFVPVEIDTKNES
jgi:LytS/YehU family sensor histidine kinase